ncbi:MAG: hypothetical protein ACO23H_12025 [Alphaproteobacteria bacterium]
MNKHIEVVKKWLNDPDSLTQEELADNVESARAASDAADYATRAAHAARNAARVAAWDGEDAERAAWTAYWVNEYEELTNE